MRIPIPGHKSQLQRILGNVTGSLDIPRGLRSGLPSLGDNAQKAGLIAGTVAGLTAVSAGISSLRRRDEGAEDDS